MTGAEIIQAVRDRIGRELEAMQGMTVEDSVTILRTGCTRRLPPPRVPSPAWFPFACLWDQHPRAVQMFRVTDEEGHRFVPGQMVPKPMPFKLTNQTYKPYPKLTSKIFYM